MSADTRRGVKPGPPAMGFAVNRLIRDGEARNEATLGLALGHPKALVFVLGDEGWLCRDGDPAFEAGTFEDLLPGGDAVLLGTTAEGAPRLAVRAPGPAGGAAAGIAARSLRSLASERLVDPDTEGQLGQAEHFLNWHGRARFCGRCGASTASEAAGYRRRCTGCGDVLFPRTDPVSIMLIHDGNGACILGRSPRFPERMWSCLAGFIEPGETLEDAVRRETLEEAGVAVGEVRYFASQPWPFPGSLMIGCIALATTTRIAFDAAELEACRWFGKDEVRAMLEGAHPGGLTAPQEFAIAHHLVRAFVEGAA